MKYFLLPVQERGVKIPAPVQEVVAPVAPPPPPPSCLSMVFHGMVECESSCDAPIVLSDMSYFLTCPLSCTLWMHKFLQSLWQHMLPGSLLLTPRNARTKTCSSEKHYPEALKSSSNLSVYAALHSFDEEEAHTE